MYALRQGNGESDEVIVTHDSFSVDEDEKARNASKRED